MGKICMLSLYSYLMTLTVMGQKSQDNKQYPEVGKLCPDLKLRNIKYYSKEQAALEDFNGKWLVLDFWNKSCGACVASFPKMDALQKEFKDKVQIMLVGIEDKEMEIQPLYAKFREKENLQIPCAFDSLIAKRYDIYVAPHIIIIDDNGIVRGITNSIHSIDIQDFLDGKTPKLPATYRFMHDTASVDERIPYDPNKPLLVSGNGVADSDFLFRSALMAWNPNVHHQSVPEKISEHNIATGRFEVVGATLNWLYNYAFFGVKTWGPGRMDMYGKYYNKPIFTTLDTSKFLFSFRYAKNIYSYSLIMPPVRATKEHIEEVMQRDLENYFGFKVHVETRNCPYWSLIASNEAKKRLKTKGIAFFKGSIYTSFSAGDYPIQNIVSLMQYHFPDKIILDETGIDNNIDVTMNCDQSDFNDVRKALKENGIELIQKQKEMKVLVIGDYSPRSIDNYSSK